MSFDHKEATNVFQAVKQILKNNRSADFIADPTAKQIVEMIDDFLAHGEELNIKLPFIFDEKKDYRNLDNNYAISSLLYTVGMPTIFQDEVRKIIARKLQSAERTSRWTERLIFSESNVEFNQEIDLPSSSEAEAKESDILHNKLVKESVANPVVSLELPLGESNTDSGSVRYRYTYNKNYREFYREDLWPKFVSVKGSKINLMEFILNTKEISKRIGFDLYLGEIYSKDHSLYESIRGRFHYVKREKARDNVIEMTERMANSLLIDFFFLKSIAYKNEIGLINIVEEINLGGDEEKIESHNDDKKNFSRCDLTPEFEQSNHFRNDGTFSIQNKKLFSYLRIKYSEDLEKGGIDILDLNRYDNVNYQALYNHWEQLLPKKHVILAYSEADRHKEFKKIGVIAKAMLDWIEHGTAAFGIRPDAVTIKGLGN